MCGVPFRRISSSLASLRTALSRPNLSESVNLIAFQTSLERIEQLHQICSHATKSQKSFRIWMDQQIGSRSPTAKAIDIKIHKHLALIDQWGFGMDL